LVFVSIETKSPKTLLTAYHGDGCNEIKVADRIHRDDWWYCIAIYSPSPRGFKIFCEAGSDGSFATNKHDTTAQLSAMI
jgi:hypothetical protein